MNKHYKIAELIVKMEPRFSPLIPRSIPYLYHGKEEPELELSLDEDLYRYYEQLHPGTDRGVIEYVATGSRFYAALLNHSGLLLHSSAVFMDGKAYLFSAPSGTGKSTHTALWVDQFAPKAKILNDDKPAIRILDDGVYVYGTPWSGKHDLSINEKVPLQGIAFLSRGKTNRIVKSAPTDSIRLILEQTIRPKDRFKASTMLDLIGSLVERIPIYRLSCNMDPEAAHVAYETMSKGE